MRIFRELEGLPTFNNAILTLGTFDGVHKGHHAILELVEKWKRKVNGESILLTFWPHPRMVLQPDNNDLKLLNTIDEKIALLEEAGLDNLIIIPFTLQFSRLSYLDFVRDIIVNKLHTKVLVIGHDHHFGKNREGSFEQLSECAPIYNFELVQSPAEEVDGLSISSTKIRNAIIEGNMMKATQFLGYPYSITGVVEHGDQRGRTIGYPTANIKIEEDYKLLPALGVYAVLVESDGLRYKGMANLGYRPTFNGKDKRLEVNIFYFDFDVYGQKLSIFFMDKLRNELNFAGLDELKNQLSLDKEQAIRTLTDY